ncbi:MAG: beta-glucosidase BglX [Cetobacterium sp.]|uniref:beta-glucosidase BglX n=1 Tax=Cetobacterium sp. TaxID=2071632 RepID=UPI003EE523A2
MKKDKLLKIIANMTLKEKVFQLFQLNGAMITDDAVISGPMQEMNLTEDIINNMGSILGVSGAEKAIEIQKKYLEKNRHGIPLLICHDVIHGHRTTFPIPLALGCSWDSEAVKEVAKVSGAEAAVSGIHCNFSPMVDLVRDPRWGRVMESTGEDPYLNSILGKAFVEGYQGENLKEDVERVAACVKHFAAYGATEGGRDYNTVDIGISTFYDMHLPAYKAAIDAGAKTVMTSFNTINGVPATVNEWLMKDVLRKELSFDGVLFSDWGAIGETVVHGCSENGKDAAYKAMKATVDVDMMSVEYFEHLEALVLEKKIDEKYVDEAVYRILDLKDELGLFENPFRGADTAREKELLLCKKHRESSRDIARKSMVLLKNEAQVLPLKDKQKIAFVGPFISNKSIRGFWSDLGFDKDSITIEEAILNRFESKDQLVICGNHKIEIESFEEIRSTVEKAKESDVIVVALGEDQNSSGEGRCLTDIRLPGLQEELLKELYKTGKKVVVVLFNGRPLDLRAVFENSDAILEAWFPGVEGGNAVLDILFGSYNPGGKITMSFPYSVGQVPIHYNHFKTGRPSEIAGAFYKCSYLDSPHWAMLPFGYGLSYTQFQYSNFKISKGKMIKGKEESIEVTIDIKNTGLYNGEEIVQLYIQDEFGSRVRPVKELKGFKKVFLKQNEEKEIKFIINEEMLKFYTIENKIDSEVGRFKVFVGTNSAEKNSLEFELIK